MEGLEPPMFVFFLTREVLSPLSHISILLFFLSPMPNSNRLFLITSQVHHHICLWGILFELQIGVEPMTSPLPRECSTNWAIAAFGVPTGLEPALTVIPAIVTAVIELIFWVPSGFEPCHLPSQGSTLPNELKTPYILFKGTKTTIVGEWWGSNPRPLESQSSALTNWATITIYCQGKSKWV